MPRQPIAYAGTTIEATKSATEIIALLVAHRAEQTSIEWENGQPTCVSFVLTDAQLGRVPIRLEARVDAVTRLLLKEKPYNSYRGVPNAREYEVKLRAQARRIVWRHLRDLIEQQLIAVKIGQYTLVETFMHGVQIRTPEGESTLGPWMQAAIQAGGFNQDKAGRLMLPAAAGKDAEES